MKAILFDKTVANSLNQQVVLNLINHYKADYNAALISYIEEPYHPKNYMEQLAEKNVDFIDLMQFTKKDFYENALTDCSAVDSDLLQKMSKYEEIIFSQLTRCGYEYRDYAFLLEKYYQILRYWNDFLDKKKIELFVTFNTMHEGINYIIYCLCKIKGIKVVISFQSPVYGYMYFLHEIEDAGYDMLEEIQKAEKLAQTGDIELPPDYQAVLNQFEGQKDTTPFYMKRKRLSVFERIFINIKKTIKLKNLKGTSFLKEVSTKRKNYKARVKGYKKIKKHYDKLAVIPDLKEKYIYFPIHHQPENTSNPMGGRFEFQYLAIEMIAKNLPDGYYVYAKEHPTQYENFLRSKESFSKLNNNPKIKLVDSEFSSKQLVENCMAVATLTGTAAWEAILTKKPALMFGDVIYKYAKGAFRIYNNADCIEAIANIIKGVEITSLDNKILLKAMSEVSVKGSLDVDYIEASGIQDEENIEGSTKGYIKTIDNL